MTGNKPTHDAIKLKFLNPKKGKPRNVKFATFDIEANDWIKFEMVGFYDGRDYYQFDSIGAFFDHVLRKCYRSFYIFGHYAGKYDSLFLLDHAHRERLGFQFTTITQGSKILCLKFKKSKHTWNFVDSSGLFPASSLDGLTKSFDVQNKKLTGTIDFKGGERVDRRLTTHREYLRNDCLGLYQVVERFLQDPKVSEEGFNFTVASQALSMWRRTLKAPIRMTPQSVQDFVRSSYVGGRVEIFKMKGSGLNYYDVNSLYPFVLRSMRLPVEHAKRTRNLSIRLGFFDCTVVTGGSYIPVLPLKIDGKLIFPNGRFRGVFFSEEIKLALENGYQIEKIHDGHEFTESQDLFAEYIDYFFRQKQESGKGTAGELVAKYLLNALYGKFGQKEERLILKTFEGEKFYYPFHSEETFRMTGLIQVPRHHRAPHMLVHIAAACTSYARIHMARNCYLPKPESCFYTDTDSIFTSEKLPVSDELGGLKLEFDGLSGVFKQPKAYYLEKNNSKIQCKIKGFSKDYVSTLSRVDFEAGNIRETKLIPASLKTSLIRNKNYLSLVGITKAMVSGYSKRRVLSNFDTEPWEVKNGIILNHS